MHPGLKSSQLRLSWWYILKNIARAGVGLLHGGKEINQYYWMTLSVLDAREAFKPLAYAAVNNARALGYEIQGNPFSNLSIAARFSNELAEDFEEYMESRT